MQSLLIGTAHAHTLKSATTLVSNKLFVAGLSYYIGPCISMPQKSGARNVASPASTLILN